MKKIILTIAAVCVTFSLASCGMTSEEISTYMTSLETSYKSGNYDEAHDEITILSDAYKKMTDEQKTKFDELKTSVKYAEESSDAINDSLSKAQAMLDHKMYFEASQELETLTSDYTLPPAEQKNYDEMKSAADNGINNWKAYSAMQEAEQLLNSGDYTAAADKLSTLDISSLTQDQQTEYQTIQTSINDAKTAAAAAKAAAEAKAKAEAEAEQKEKDNAVMEFYDGEYHYNGHPVGKGDLQQYLHGEISKEEFESRMYSYQAQ